MMDPKYRGAGNFASTGGWNLAKGVQWIIIVCINS